MIVSCLLPVGSVSNALYVDQEKEEREYTHVTRKLKERDNFHRRSWLMTVPVGLRS